LEDGIEKVIMESVDILRPEDDGVYLENIFGEHLKIQARIKEMRLVDHHILLETEGDMGKRSDIRKPK
jgi:predicted RNA-binding protein